jgi:hypothetical protein
VTAKFLPPFEYLVFARFGLNGYISIGVEPGRPEATVHIWENTVAGGIE